ncbi:uncharacterized protein LACBIDRAFT_328488 [Laccaria bicolor S238N-H82]|uniref:Predicted protein n=1 Tax=Laccaria bicolor (strain S238N-H82 / ATCC MYA-4686) TaxID=486041 RepID=B0DEZ9_LACBS|nr:uncharacterized protein LACBIDRAFT_328488 [Laccaria bicolor S238N-H82]EDR06761.1 predicted protein [Laccaria bicolor S238N-H82]|eukprot:XP_001882608.1 predicted protein [Laccaria bicolor S238N-H82]
MTQPQLPWNIPSLNRIPPKGIHGPEAEMCFLRRTIFSDLSMSLCKILQCKDDMAVTNGHDPCFCEEDSTHRSFMEPQKPTQKEDLDILQQSQEGTINIKLPPHRQKHSSLTTKVGNVLRTYMCRTLFGNLTSQMRKVKQYQDESGAMGCVLFMKIERQIEKDSWMYGQSTRAGSSAVQEGDKIPSADFKVGGKKMRKFTHKILPYNVWCILIGRVEGEYKPSESHSPVTESQYSISAPSP